MAPPQKRRQEELKKEEVKKKKVEDKSSSNDSSGIKLKTIEPTPAVVDEVVDHSVVIEEVTSEDDDYMSTEDASEDEEKKVLIEEVDTDSGSDMETDYSDETDESSGSEDEDDDSSSASGVDMEELDCEEDETDDTGKAKIPAKKRKLRDVAIGIDLGTTYSTVGVFQDGKVTIFPGVMEENEPLGSASDSLGTTNAIFNCKTLIGRKFKDVKALTKYWPFEIINSGKNPTPKIAVNSEGGRKQIVPEEFCTLLLKKLKEIAESHLHSPVSSAVISVPAIFTTTQRSIVKDCAEKAELRVLRMVIDSTAAGLAYGLNNDADDLEAHNVLIFDLGSDNLNVTVMTMDMGMLKVKSVVGVSNFGGEHFVNRMVDYFAKDIEKTHKLDIFGDKKILLRVRKACEKAKITLSSATKAAVEIDELRDGVDYRVAVSRARFDKMNDDLFLKCLEPVEKALKYAQLDKTAVDEVVLVGGSSRIPQIQKILQDFFNLKKFDKSLNPDEAVVSGAAIQAAILSGEKSPILQEFLLLDATPCNLGVQTGNGKMTTFIKRNTTLPTKATKIFTTNVDNQTHVKIKIVEGDNSTAFVGSLELAGMIPLSKGLAQIEVTFEVDTSNCLSITATDLLTRTKSLQSIADIPPPNANTNEANSTIAVTDDNKVNIKSRDLKAFCDYILSTVDKADTKKNKNVGESDLKTIIEKCNKIRIWLKKKTKDCVDEDKAVKRMFEETKKLWLPVIAKMHEEN